MHPLFGSFRRVLFYLLAWVPVACILAYLLTTLGRLPFVQSLAFCGPLSLIYAFMCLESWYLCRVIPITQGKLLIQLSAQLLNAVVSSGIWTLIAKGVAVAEGIESQRLTGAYPLLFGTGVLLYLTAIAVHYMVLATMASRAAEQRESEARLLAGEAELRALRAQINPHFLYNSLNSISALTSIDGAKARNMCIQLSEFLRSTLGMSERTRISIAEEVELLRRYLDIEKVRFGARLNFEAAVAPDCMDELVPPLLLQPLVENAIIHGIAGMIDSGILRLEIARQDSSTIRIVIENSYDPDAPKRKQAGYGLVNVRKRLHTVYGQAAGVAVDSAGDRFRVQLSLPHDGKQKHE
jgi:LytS/YehU family sensor histidine kinase